MACIVSSGGRRSVSTREGSSRFGGRSRLSRPGMGRWWLWRLLLLLTNTRGLEGVDDLLSDLGNQSWIYLACGVGALESVVFASSGMRFVVLNPGFDYSVLGCIFGQDREMWIKQYNCQMSKSRAVFCYSIR